MKRKNMIKMSMKKTGTLSVLILLLSILLVFALTSCSEAGSEVILSKDELRENATRGIPEDAEYVRDCLDGWQFPLFDGSKMLDVEYVFEKKFYISLPELSTLAARTAEIFLDEYYDTVELGNKDAVTDALLYSYVDAIDDRYSYYRTAEEYEGYKTGLSGNFVGVGITVRQDEESGNILVTEVLEGGGAADAGVLAGDIIVAVDGKYVSDVGYSDAINSVRGEEGTFAVLTVQRDGAKIELSAERRPIVEKSVTYSITDGIGYIRITSFNANTDEQFYEAIDEMERVGVSGVIYDVRSNGGGYLSSVENMLDYIAPKGLTLASFSNGYSDDYVAKDRHTFLIPTVVLVNGSTASAAELFAAGIRDMAAMGYMKATVVGTTTLGKGVMQTTYRLGDGSAVTLTVAYYNPPSGVNYNGVGIIPAVTEENVAEQINTAYAEITKLIND